MTRTQKKVFGFLGVLTVAAITAFAVVLPVPETQATSDKIKISVVNDVPKVDITNIKNGEVIIEPDQTFTVAYANVRDVTVNVEYTDLNNNTYDLGTIDTIEADFVDGEKNYSVHLVREGE